MKRTTIMADEELLYKVEQIAIASGLSKAEVIRRALEHYVELSESNTPREHPLLAIVGLAAEDAVAMDLANGNDEMMLWDKQSFDDESDR